MRELIRKLCECDGPPGHEGPVRERVLAEIKGLADQVAVSPLGSIHATLNPSGDCKIMVAAHMDELGLIISHVDPRGYARFQSLGRIVPEALPGQRIRFSNGAIGVVGTSGLQGKPKPLRLDDLFLDFGAASQRACPVQVGDCGAFVHGFLLAAHAEGLGACPQAMPTGYPDAIRAELGIADNLAIVLCISVGYPDLEMPLNQYRSLRQEVSEYTRWYGF